MTPDEETMDCCAPTTFKDEVDETRKFIKELGKRVELMKEYRKGCPEDEGENRSEVMANLTLCYRHIEDASMRLGKVLQHLNGGVSHYDKNVVGDPR